MKLGGKQENAEERSKHERRMTHESAVYSSRNDVKLFHRYVCQAAQRLQFAAYWLTVFYSVLGINARIIIIIIFVYKCPRYLFSARGQKVIEILRHEKK